MVLAIKYRLCSLQSHTTEGFERKFSDTEFNLGSVCASKIITKNICTRFGCCS